ncbi:transport and Golgi organization protein 1 isoform X2 [Ischnura elegans]|uniref:transport and Golgi organization protein 1 isoform X2 n=1 Tax=Ischnura elegans TaxID=197161 RepID=UPI001ED887B2|nr:transport and Golgi organization protein 1 isoform X2 [Ischnura elegans]
MFGYLKAVFLAIVLCSYSEGSNISDQRLCYDPKCNEPLSLARTLLKYVKSYDGALSFQPGTKVVIYSKSAGSNPELWGAEVDGKRGYIPKKMVQEYQVFHPDSTLKHIVPTAESDEPINKEEEYVVDERETETTLDKPMDVSHDDNPASINSESSFTTEYDVVDGTTLYDDALGLATPTVNPLDTMTMSAVPIESTTSYIATSSDMSTATLTQSDMAPISPTTMMGKPEDQEGDTKAVDKSTEEVAGVVESVLNIMSDLVSGGEQTNNDKDAIQDDKDGKVKVDVLVPNNDPKGDTSKLVDQGGIVAGEKDDGSLLKNMDASDDEDEEDDAEDEDEEEVEDEYDGDEDDEEEIEIVEDVKNDDNALNEVFKDSPELKGGGNDLLQKKEGGKLENLTSNAESGGIIDASTPSNSQTSEGNTPSTLKNVEVKVALEEKVGHMENTSEAISSSHVDSTSSGEKEISSESSENRGSNESLNPDQLPDSSTVGLEAQKLAEDVNNSVPEVHDDHILHNENKLDSVSDGISSYSYSDRKESHADASTVLPIPLGEKKSESQVSGDQSITLDLSDTTSEITTDSPIETSTMINVGYPKAEQVVQTESSNIVGDEHNLYPGQSSQNPMPSGESAYNTNPTSTLGTQHEEPSGQVDPSNSYGSDYISSPGPVDANTLEAEEAVKFVEEPKPQQAIERDHDMERDESLRSKEAETSKDYVTPETLNISETENVLPSPEESSPGIFSVVFDSLGSGYGFVSNMIFGSADESIESQESSTQGVSQILSGKYSDSESNIYQPNPVKDAQGLAAEGDSVYGRSLNSYCEGSSETDCAEQSSVISSEAKASAGDQLQGNPEMSSWMAFPSFAIGNDSNGMFNINVPSYGAIIYSIITGIIVLCFFLGHYFIEGSRRDVVLLAKINTLEKELTVSSKECLILKEKLKQFEMKSSDFDDSAEVINAMKNELEKVQSEKAQLEKELEATTEAGLEMEQMVSQFLSSQQDSKTLMESIEQLQLQANKQQAKISSLENSLVAKTQENEKLAQELGVTESKVQELEEDLKQVSENLHQRDEEHSKRYAELKELGESQHNKYLEDVKNKTIETEMAHTRCKSLEATLTEMKEMLAVKENEICVLQECLQQLKISNGDDPDKAEDELKNILNFGKLKAELTAVSKERDNLKEKLQGEEDARRLLEDHVKVIREEVEKLRKCHEAAEREKVEAQTRLEVLSSYFKEKESQLQKELGNKEALWMQKHTDASTIMQRMKSLEEEVENYKKEDANSKPNVSERVTLIESREITITHPLKECKDDIFSKHDDLIGSATEKLAKETFGDTLEKKGSQTETLKKEILDQERGYKTQLATFEKKAHENWVAARQAERKLEESKQEASQLRNRLTMADKTHPASTSQNGDESKPNMSMIDSNGELSASPLHLGLASNSSVDMLLSDPHSHYLDPNSSPPHVGGGSRLPLPPLLPPPPFPPPPLPSRSPYHHPMSPPLPFMPLPPPDANLFATSMDGHRPPPLGRMSSPPPAPSPSQSPHLPHNDSRGGEFPSPYRDRGGGGRSSSPSGLYMPPDERSLGEEWRRYCTPPPHSSHSSDYPMHPYPPPRPHWEDEPPHPTSGFRPPPSQRTESHRELKVRQPTEHQLPYIMPNAGSRSKGSHSSESDVLEKSSRHGGKL